MKGLLKAVLALIIVAALGGIGYAVATYTDVGKTNTTPTATVVAQAASGATSTPIPTFTPNPNFSGTGAALPGQGGNANGGQNRQGTPQAGAAQAGTTTQAGAGNANQTSPAANGTPGAGGRAGTGGQTRPGGGQVAGTIASYDEAGKLLVVTAQNGNSRNVSVANATFTKAEKITAEDISKTANTLVVIMGDKGSDGTYTARSIQLVDQTALRGGGQGVGGAGFGGGGNGGQGAGGNPQGTTLIIPAPTLDGTVLSGKTFQGEDVKVNLSDTTTITKQGPATAADLAKGQRVTVIGQADAEGKVEATLVSIS